MKPSPKRIAIIGAGWTGIGCLRILKEQGYEIDVYEKNDDIGGTWHPINNYAGLKLHSSALTIEYYDFPLPNSIDRYERLYSHQVFNYLNQYCQHHQLKSHIYFKKSVKKVSYHPKNKTSDLYFLDEAGKEQVATGYDYVIYTHGYADRKIPLFKDAEKFSGEIHHALSISDTLLREYIAKNKKITILGGSKGATDFIIKLYDYGYQVNWLLRKPYWFFNYTLRKRWLQEKKNFLIYKFLFLFGLIVAKKFPAFALRIWSWFGLIDTFGERHSDFKKFHFGMIDENQFRILREYYRSHGMEGDIEAFYEDGLILKDGKNVLTDLVICCTGSGPSQLELALEIDNQPFDTKLISNLYRSRVIPEIPNLIFTAYHQFSIGTVDGLIQGNWIDSYMQNNFSTEYLQRYATPFEKPFFSKSALFDSQSYIIFNISKMYYPFFYYHEISTILFLKWFIDSTFRGDKKIVPFKFQSPNNLKRQTTHTAFKLNPLHYIMSKISTFLGE